MAIEPGHRLETWKDCQGRTHYADVEVSVTFPALACPITAAEQGDWSFVIESVIGFPVLACIWVWQPYDDEPLFQRALLIVPPYAPPVLLEHELRHLTNDWHPVFLPMVWISKECRAEATIE